MSGVVRIDTRQKAGKHIHVDSWLTAHGIPYEYRKLDFGDYLYVDDDGSALGNVCVDSKKDVQELAMDLTRDHDRFRRECLRAREAGWRLVILVEQHPEYGARPARVDGWVSGVCRRCEAMRHGLCDPLDRWCRCARKSRKPVQGPQLRLAMLQMQARYGVRFDFCNRLRTARRICELLGVEVDDGRDGG